MNFEQCVNLGVYAKSSHRHGSLQPLPDTQNDTEHVHTREQQRNTGRKKNRADTHTQRNEEEVLQTFTHKRQSKLSLAVKMWAEKSFNQNLQPW